MAALQGVLQGNVSVRGHCAVCWHDKLRMLPSHVQVCTGWQAYAPFAGIQMLYFMLQVRLAVAVLIAVGICNVVLLPFLSWN